MKTETLHAAIKICLSEIRERAVEASRIATAAEACAEAGSISEAVQVSMDIDQLFYEATRLHDTALLFKRLADE